MRADPAAAAAKGEFTRSAWGYLAMVCVYLYGMVCLLFFAIDSHL